MTGRLWVRLDHTFPTNPKILDLLAAGRHRAVVAYVCSLAYAGQHGTDGHIPHAALPMIHARPADATVLVTAGLWHVNGAGWIIHDWLHYQPPNDTLPVDKPPTARSAAARKAALARWHPDP